MLTQIHFKKGMRGRFGSTSERSQVEPQWYEFFGNVELGRAKVSTTKSTYNFDNPPADGLFLNRPDPESQDRAATRWLARVNSCPRLRQSLGESVRLQQRQNSSRPT